MSDQPHDEKQASHDQPQESSTGGEPEQDSNQASQPLESDDLSQYAKRASDAQQYKGVRDYYEIVYPEFAHLGYGMQQVILTIESIEQSNPDQSIKDYCHDIRMLCSNLRDNCRNAVAYGDDPTTQTARHKIVDNLDAVVMLVLHKPFIDFHAGFTRPPEQQNQSLEKILSDQDEWDKWYFQQLGFSERCFVLAMSALESAPFREVTVAARSLEVEFKKASQTQQSKEGQSSDTPQSTRQLLAKTFTMRQTISGTERVFWQRPEMVTRVPAFVADEAGLGDEQTFLEVLQRWAIQGTSERSLRAIRSLAIIWWRKDQAYLRQLAQEWANSKDANRWFCAAVLLSGAYRAERVSTSGSDESLANSEILAWLKRWAQPQSSVVQLRTALSAFGMIGASWPVIALDGLDSAMSFLPAKPHSSQHQVKIEAYVYGIINYAIIAWSGQVRAVVERLAQTATEYVKRPRGLTTSREMAQRSRQPELGIQVMLASFFFIAATSLGGDSGDSAPAYELQKPLPDSPNIPDESGHDIILAGILSMYESGLRQNVITLLAVAIVEDQARPAFDLLERWALITWREPSHVEMRHTYTNIVSAVALRISQWERELHLHRPAYPIFRRKLDTWIGPQSTFDKPISHFGRAVKQELEKQGQ